MNTRAKAIFSLTVLLFAIPLLGDAKSSFIIGPQFEDVAEKVFPCVVRVESRNDVRKVAAGVVFDKDGHVVTTALITPRDEKIFITTSDGKRSEAEFLGMDSETHLAVIKAKERNLVPISKAKTKLSPGAWIGVISMSPENTPQVSQGIVSSVAQDRLRLNVWVGRGMSGSPVVNKQGQMVGLLRGVYMDEQPIVFEFQEREIVGSGYVFSRAEAPASGMAMAIPIEVVESVTAEIKEKGKVERGWLGVRIWMNEDDRVEITEVEKDSPAELANLKEGDIVLQFDGEDVGNTEMLAKMIRQRRPGETVTIKIEREGKTQDIRVKLGEFTEEDVWKDFERKFPNLFRARPFKEFERVEPYSVGKPFRWSFGQRKYIGVYIQELNKELSEYFGVDKGTGLLIERIDEDGPADKAGLRVGDVIINADGKRVESTQELSKLIQDKEKGDKITIEFIRDKKTRTVEVEVDEEETSFSYAFPGDARQKLAEAYKKQGEENYKRFMEQQKDMSEELRRQFKKQQKDAEKYYKDALIYRMTPARSKGIRV